MATIQSQNDMVVRFYSKSKSPKHHREYASDSDSDSDSDHERSKRKITVSYPFNIKYHLYVKFHINLNLISFLTGRNRILAPKNAYIAQFVGC